MRTLLVNDFIYGSVSGEETFWSVLGSQLNTTETLALSSFKGDLRAFLAARNPDVVVSNSLLGPLPLPSAAKSIVILQDNFIAMERILPMSLKSRFKRLLGVQGFYPEKIKKQHAAIAAAQACVAVSKSVASAYSVNCEVIPIGVDTELFKPLENRDELRQKYAIPVGRVGIYVGSTHAVKGFEKILEAAMKNPDVFYIFVLKDTKSFKSPRNVKVFRQVPQTTLSELYNCADFFIGRSLVETLWLAPIEAMFCNVPVDVTSVGIFADWKPENKQSRAEALAAGLDKETMLRRWQELLARV